MTGRLAGETVLVTAAGQGIGRAIALACAGQGANVVATDINKTALDALKGEAPDLTTERLDVLDEDGVQAWASRHENATVLVNCAGWVHNGTILDCTPADWARSFDLNVTSMYRTTRAVLPAMLRGGRGSIVNIASVASSIRGVPNRFAYGTSKGAVIALTKAVAADFVEQGIRCNAICPGTVDTPSLGDRMAATGDLDAARAAFVARQPMKRLGTAEEIAHLAVYLASAESAFTTGAAHVIDGGWTM